MGKLTLTSIGQEVPAYILSFIAHLLGCVQPKRRWRDTILQDLRALYVNYHQWEKYALDRVTKDLQVETGNK